MLANPRSRRRKKGQAQVSTVVGLLKEQNTSLQALVSASASGSSLVGDVPWPISAGRWNSKPFNTVLSYEASQALVSSTTNPTFGALYQTLSSFSGYGDYAAVFDQYRILLIEVRFLPASTEQTAAATTAGLMTSVLDYDDSNTPATISSLLEYETEMTVGGTTSFTRRYVPHAAVAVYSGAFTSYGNVPSPWIDVGSTAVQHFGVKTGWTQTGSVYSYSIVVRAHVQFKNTR